MALPGFAGFESAVVLAVGSLPSFQGQACSRSHPGVDLFSFQYSLVRLLSLSQMPIQTPNLDPSVLWEPAAAQPFLSPARWSSSHEIYGLQMCSFDHTPEDGAVHYLHNPVRLTPLRRQSLWDPRQGLLSKWRTNSPSLNCSPGDVYCFCFFPKFLRC